MVGNGEMQLDCVLHDLRRLYAKIEVKVSDPIAKFCETVVETSTISCFADAPNKKNRIVMIAEPLEKSFSEGISTGLLNGNLEEKILAKSLQTTFGWDLLSARNLWAFGPTDDSPNIIVNDTIPSEVDIGRLSAVKENIQQGFQWSTREGPLCDERTLIDEL